MVQYREATRADLSAIVEIYNSTIASRRVTADTEPISIESRISWFESHSPEKRPLWMVEEENKVVGWVSFHSFYGRPAYDATVEISIYLDYRYRAMGFGKQILKHCIEYAPKLGVKNLLGFIFSHNEPSLKLFKQFEFEEWGFLPNVAVLDGVERSVFLLGKRISH